MSLVVAVSMERSSDPARERGFKPGYTFDYLLGAYSDFLRGAGLSPLLVPVGEDPAEAAVLLGRVDGLLLSGGSDLDPSRWGEAELEPGGLVTPLGSDEIARSRWEDALTRAALDGGVPILGICRGLQQLNATLGGSLWQDLERQLGHAGHVGEDPWRPVHGLEAVSGHPLAGRLAGSQVTSSHHQALRRLGEGLEPLVCAAGEPDVVEAALWRGPSFALGVQWHPERMAQDPSSRLLGEEFRAAIEARRTRR